MVLKLIEDTMTGLENEVDFAHYDHILIIPGVRTMPAEGYGMICYCANPGMLTGVKGKLAFTTVRSRSGKTFSGASDSQDGEQLEQRVEQLPAARRLLD